MNYRNLNFSTITKSVLTNVDKVLNVIFVIEQENYCHFYRPKNRTNTIQLIN